MPVRRAAGQRQPRAGVFVNQLEVKTATPDKIIRHLEFSPNFDPGRLEKDMAKLREKIETRKRL